MMYARIASAAVGLAAVVLLGAGLGSYTVGGFQMREPIDVIAGANARISSGHVRADNVSTQAPIDHVCKGCDAKLHREDAWYTADSSVDTDDEWAREDDEHQDAVRVALADDPRPERRASTTNGEADVVVDKDLVMYAGAAVSHLDR